MEELKETLKKQIIEALSLEDMRPEDIDDAAPLFGDGLGLDSIDRNGNSICHRHKYVRSGARFVSRH